MEGELWWYLEFLGIKCQFEPWRICVFFSFSSVQVIWVNDHRTYWKNTSRIFSVHTCWSIAVIFPLRIQLFSQWVLCLETGQGITVLWGLGGVEGEDDLSPLLIHPCSLLIIYNYSDWLFYFVLCCSVVKLCLTLQPHGLQHARLPCPSPFLRACSNSCPLSQWWHPTILSSVTPFSCLQSFPAAGSFPMSQLFTSGGQSILSLRMLCSINYLLRLNKTGPLGCHFDPGV